MEASMDVSHFLNSHLLDPKVGGKRLWADMLEQAVHAEACGYDGVGIPEHHLVNILLIPSPLQMAVKMAAHTKHLRLGHLDLPVADPRHAGVSRARWCRRRRCATDG
jgi:alkanesulfonate monooxygenase SsuD/methylene tetrahydromethanopterin reductase-like flavin-dependent oxidoreductase (luciferase family)